MAPGTVHSPGLQDRNTVYGTRTGPRIQDQVQSLAPGQGFKGSRVGRPEQQAKTRAGHDIMDIKGDDFDIRGYRSSAQSSAPGPATRPRIQDRHQLQGHRPGLGYRLQD